ncbi:MAG: hypothetical protein EPO55_12445 [Reyranella sp.]|nr:MAG: hypothetical protein EPO55_12445 [Reyranella sp.]
MSLSTLTTVHVVVSLIGLASGALVLRDMLRSKQAAGLTAVFLLTTAGTTVTGLLFPSTRLGVGHVTGALSLVVLVPTLMALYGYRLAGPWRGIYASGATAALYLNVFIGVRQAFAKSATVQLLAPPLDVTQLVTLAIFVGLGVLAVKRFRPCAAPLVRIRLPAAPV